MDVSGQIAVKCGSAQSACFTVEMTKTLPKTVFLMAKMNSQIVIQIGGVGGNRTRGRDIVTQYNTTMLCESRNSQVDKNGLNHVHNDHNHEDSNQVAEAILAINQLPLTPDEKAQMIRLLLR